ncbi:MAG: hypothetical protein EOO92_11270 [Pedobacter sp.]|nr:MAG: hypothetical protein EOO92_11270 [Pedobacter sp.]
MKILITGGKSAQALKLVNSFLDDEIILADYGDMPNFPSAKYQFITLGKRNDEVVAHNLLTFCLDHGVNAILPLHSFEIDEIVKSKVLFEEFSIKVLEPSDQQVIK